MNLPSSGSGQSALSLAGKTMMVTGSSTGIGKSIALALAQCGADIVLHGRSKSTAIKQTAAAIETMGQNVHFVMGDFEQSQTLPQIVEQAWQWKGHLDGWINNAGGDVLTGDWKNQPIEAKLEYLLRTDVTATLLLSRDVGQRMTERAKNSDSIDRQVIINIGWDQAWQGMAGDSGELFATTKGAIMSMTKSLAQSLAPAVRVNCIAPGWVQTKWGAGTSGYWNDRAIGESLMERWGRPEDIAQAAVYLCSPAADFVSGQILPVNGGFRHWQGSPSG